MVVKKLGELDLYYIWKCETKQLIVSWIFRNEVIYILGVMEKF